MAATLRSGLGKSPLPSPPPPLPPVPPPVPGLYFRLPEGLRLPGLWDGLGLRGLGDGLGLAGLSGLGEALGLGVALLLDGGLVPGYPRTAYSCAFLNDLQV